MRPENRMVTGLGAEFNLTEASAGAPGGLHDGFREEIRIHEMGAGAGGQKAAVFNQLHAPQVNLPVFLHRFGRTGLHLTGVILDGGQTVADVLGQLLALHGTHGVIL